MSLLCDLCSKTRSEYSVEFCSEGRQIKRYHEQCEGFSPSYRFKPYVDEIISFLGIEGETRKKLLALKELYALYLTREEVIALELSAHFIDRRGGWNVSLEDIGDSLDSAHDKLLEILEEKKNGKTE